MFALAVSLSIQNSRQPYLVDQIVISFKKSVVYIGWSRFESKSPHCVCADKQRTFYMTVHGECTAVKYTQHTDHSLVTHQNDICRRKTIKLLMKHWILHFNCSAVKQTEIVCVSTRLLFCIFMYFNIVCWVALSCAELRCGRCDIRYIRVFRWFGIVSWQRTEVNDWTSRKTIKKNTLMLHQPFAITDWKHFQSGNRRSIDWLSSEIACNCIV